MVPVTCSKLILMTSLLVFLFHCFFIPQTNLCHFSLGLLPLLDEVFIIIFKKPGSRTLIEKLKNLRERKTLVKITGVLCGNITVPFTLYYRCGYEFCYTCGKEWKDKKATCSCPLWEEGYIWNEDSEEEDDDFFDDEDYYDDYYEYSDDDLGDGYHYRHDPLNFLNGL
jgi:hypothetical protein